VALLVGPSFSRNGASVATKRWLRPRYSAPSGVGEMKLSSYWPDFVTGRASLMAGGRLARARVVTATRKTFGRLGEGDLEAEALGRVQDEAPNGSGVAQDGIGGQGREVFQKFVALVLIALGAGS